MTRQSVAHGNSALSCAREGMPQRHTKRAHIRISPGSRPPCSTAGGWTAASRPRRRRVPRGRHSPGVMWHSQTLNHVLYSLRKPHSSPGSTLVGGMCLSWATYIKPYTRLTLTHTPLSNTPHSHLWLDGAEESSLGEQLQVLGNVLNRHCHTGTAGLELRRLPALSLSRVDDCLVVAVVDGWSPNF